MTSGLDLLNSFDPAPNSSDGLPSLINQPRQRRSTAACDLKIPPPTQLPTSTLHSAHPRLAISIADARIFILESDHGQGSPYPYFLDFLKRTGLKKKA